MTDQPQDPQRPTEPRGQLPYGQAPQGQGQYGQGPYGQAQYGGQGQQGYPPPGQGYGQQPVYTSSVRPLTPAEERNWSIGAHLSPFLASMVGLPFLGPLVIYLVFRDRGPYIRHHSAQALNFQIIITIALWGFGLLSFVLIGIPFLVATAIAALVLPIIAAVEANNGRWYRYPLTPDWVK